jgi:CXXC-20-CXXC protein
LKILSHKYCPVCQTKVEWKRFIYKNWGWSKWNCPTCNTKLTFNLTRRFFSAIFFLIIIFILVESTRVYELPAIVYILLIIIFWLLFTLNDGVIVHKTLSKKEKELSKLSKKPLYIALLISLVVVLIVYLIMLNLGHVGEVTKALLYAYLIFFVVLAIFLLLGRYQKN